ncbi:hypothetical protein [Methylobacterium sp. J-090]|uniref:hypothetical protein n=1 Tax=Methylobacterium sp. J-090 TaxID=2836666 RepID=UPI00391D3A8E
MKRTMRTKTFAIATSLILSLTGAAFAQTAAGGGSATGNMNNPGSVKSSGEKVDERMTGSATGNTTGTVGGTPGREGGAGNMGGGTGASSNTGVGTGAAGNSQAPRQ